MDNQFIYCPKCSTRNFADDEVCEVCKTKLSSATSNHGTKKTTTEQPTNWKALSIIVGAVIIFYFAFIKNDVTSNDNHSSSSSSGEIYDNSNRVFWILYKSKINFSKLIWRFANNCIHFAK